MMSLKTIHSSCRCVINLIDTHNNVIVEKFVQKLLDDTNAKLEPNVRHVRQ